MQNDLRIKLANGGKQAYHIVVTSTTGFVAIACDSKEPKIFSDASKKRKALVIPAARSITLWPCLQNDVSPFGQLLELECPRNQLTQLEGLALASLYSLDCSFNLLRHLALVHPILSSDGKCSMTFLNCSNNRIAELDLSCLPKIQYVRCASNRLQSLTFGRFSKVCLLDCSRNRLKSVGFTKLLELEYFNAQDNPLRRPRNKQQPPSI
jgi:hypothetical protein